MYTQSVPFVLIFLTILAGILLNNKGLADLKVDFKSEIARIDARLDSIKSDLNHFYAMMGRLEGRIEALEKRVG